MNDDYVPILINDRSTALLHLIDAIQLSEKELRDIYDGVFNRMKDYFTSDDRKSNEPIIEIGIFEDDGNVNAEFLYTLEKSNDFANLLGSEETSDRDLDDQEFGFNNA